MPSGGRPVYTEDFQTLQNEISIFEKITEQNCRNCVLSGCEYTEYLNPNGQTYSAGVTEGYAIIDGKICHVNAWNNASFSHNDLPLKIELVQTDSVERIQLVNGETAPLTINYEGEIRTKSNTVTGTYITMNRRKSSASTIDDRFTCFHDLYIGFTRKAEVEEVNKRAYIIDLHDYLDLNSTLPTLNAVFVYQNHILQPCTITIPVSDETKYGGLPEGTYYAFCIRHYLSVNGSGVGTDFLLYNWSRRFIAKYNDQTVLECIKDAFGESIATYDKDGRMSKEHVKMLNNKADKSYVDTELAKKASSGSTYSKNQIDDALALKLDRSQWEEDRDILWGEIKIWAGSNIPAKYELCDGRSHTIPQSPSDQYWDLYQKIRTTFNVSGANGTPTGEFALPDLRGRFIVGMGRGTGDKEFGFNTTGGASEVALTVDQMPAHRHKAFAEDDVVNISSYGTDNGPANYQDYNEGASGDGAGGLTDTSVAGGNQPHPNLPPYYTLAYIIRVAK